LERVFGTEVFDRGDMIEQALQTKFLSKTAITAIVGTRVLVGERHFVDVDDLPALTIERPFQADARRNQELDGTECDLQFPHFEFVAHALLKEEAQVLAKVARQVLHGIRNGGTVSVTNPETGGAATVTIEQVDVLAEFDDPEEDIGHGNTDRPRVIRARVGWREDVTSL